MNKKSKKIIFKFIILISLLMITNIGKIFPINNLVFVNDSKQNEPYINNSLEVHFIDTGQSDAILLISNNEYMLIDSGNTKTDDVVNNYLNDLNIKHLDYFIISHFDADHIGGADTVINNFMVENTFVPNGDANTLTYKNFIKALEQKKYHAAIPQEAEKIKFGNAYFQVFNTKGEYNNANDNSLIVLITNINDQMLFTGDISMTVENDLNIEDIDLLKVAHHGSKTSTSEKFLAQVTPEIAVICVGEDNRYNHPSSQVLNHLADQNIKVYRTDSDGNIVFESTGNGINYISKVDN